MAYPARLLMTTSNTSAKQNNSISTSKQDPKRKLEFSEISLETDKKELKIWAFMKKTQSTMKRRKL